MYEKETIITYDPGCINVVNVAQGVRTPSYIRVDCTYQKFQDRHMLSPMMYGKFVFHIFIILNEF